MDRRAVYISSKYRSRKFRGYCSSQDPSYQTSHILRMLECCAHSLQVRKATVKQLIYFFARFLAAAFASGFGRLLLVLGVGGGFTVPPRPPLAFGAALGAAFGAKGLQGKTHAYFHLTLTPELTYLSWQPRPHLQSQ